MVTVMLAALSAGMSFSYLLEMPQKMNYDAAMYLDVTHTLYRYFAVIGGPIEVGGLVSAIVLCFLVRGAQASSP